MSASPKPSTRTDICSPQPVPSHLFGIVFFAALYLVYGGIGAKLTGHHPFFWMDEKIVGSKEKVAGYSSGFIALAAACESIPSDWSCPRP